MPCGARRIRGLCPVIAASRVVPPPPQSQGSLRPIVDSTLPPTATDAADRVNTHKYTHIERVGKRGGAGGWRRNIDNWRE
ncbi:hypothetical protein NL676_005462 [Syzygium grande]|nr:hypothetical protein NL676_005462 [Syzygium grande]